MMPEGDSFVACDQASFTLAISGQSRNNCEWYYAEHADSPGTRLQGQDANSITIPESGYYYAIVTSGICRQESERKLVTVAPAGEILVPNVFTPNSDDHNDLFEIESNMDIVGLWITNRYGRTIFTSGPDNKWSGDGSPAGVYYWLVTYRTCAGEVKSMKGFVQLLR
jgi:gliding motility-associated-like protein